jgi:hypothetical protein
MLTTQHRGIRFWQIFATTWGQKNWKNHLTFQTTQLALKFNLKKKNCSALQLNHRMGKIKA